MNWSAPFRNALICAIFVTTIWPNYSVWCKTGSFPNLFNVAKGKPIFAQPAQSSCSRLFYCRSTTDSSSVLSCQNAEFCDASCPTRSVMPDYVNLFDFALLSQCAFKDVKFPAPNSASGYSVFYSPTEVASGNCSVTADGSLLSEIDDSPSFFTITSWISLDFESSILTNSSEKIPIVQKVCTNGVQSVVIFSLHINRTAIVFKASNGKQFTYVEDALFQSNSWFHLALQVSNRSLSFFVNGTGDDQLPLQAYSLSAENLLKYPMSNCTFYIGASFGLNSSSGFVGHMADMRYYETTLANREINAVFVGNSTLKPVYIDSECRCPAMYPRIADQFSRLCLTNDPTSTDAEVRVNRRAHPLEYMTDGDTATFWLSKLINKVVVTIDLLDQYQVFYILMQFYSPLPKKLIIERQTATSTWAPWQYYADDCALRFGMPNNGRLTKLDDINCIQLGRSNSPYSLGNISFSALQLTPAQRPGADNFFNNPDLLDFVRVQKIRVTFDGHMYDEGSFVNERHLYFGVFELEASGRCDCNGHASACTINGTTGTYQCACDGNTAGRRCDSCEDLYNAKPYRKTEQCRPCNCNGHATSCVYNATIDSSPNSFDTGDGSVCVNCGDNTRGRYCEMCDDGYYKENSSSLAMEPCLSCDCDVQGTVSDALKKCAMIGGQCKCKKNVEGRSCNRCKAGFYRLNGNNEEGCSPCSCNVAGVANNVVDCDQFSGYCTCKPKVVGPKCDHCQFGYHSLSINNSQGCEPCQCDPVGASSTYCNPTDGACQCRKNVVGLNCDRCAPSFYNLTINGCMQCSCNADGIVINTDDICESDTGQCRCRKFVAGYQCDVCMDGYAQFGIDAETGCLECRCSNGTKPGKTCDKDTGVCACRSNVAGLSCNLCKPGFWNLSSDNPIGCQSCECDLTGANSTCDQNTGRCSCFPHRTGLKCNTCVNGFYKAPLPMTGCLPCKCSNLTSSGQCDIETGQCECRLDRLGVGGQNCDQCLSGFFGYNSSLGSCRRCDCFWPGVLGGKSSFQPCNSVTGQCICKEHVTGSKCDQCKSGFSILREDNPYGCSAAPSLQPPPRYVDSNSSAIQLVWPPPLRPNGAIRNYGVIRNGTIIANVTPPLLESSSISYTDVGLSHLKYYQYRIMASTDFGSTTSIPVVFSTLSGAPVGKMSFSVDSVEENAIAISWAFSADASMTAMEKENLWFQVFKVDNDTKLVYRGTKSNNTRISKLEPFTQFTFRFETCNERSECIIGGTLNVSTREAPPEEQPAPRLTAVSNDSVYVEWDPPTRPNGVITFYELWMRDITPSSNVNSTSSDNDTDSEKSVKRILVFHPAGMWIRQRSSSGKALALPPPARNFTVTGLKPYRLYDFQIVTQNDVGKLESEWASIRTLEAPPAQALQPVVTAKSASQLEVTWPDPQSVDFIGGTVMNASLFSFKRQSTSTYGPPVVVTKEATLLPNAPRYLLLKGLLPFVVVGVRLELCTRLGCINSTVVNGTTLPAAPQGVSAPNATGNSSTIVNVKWIPPSAPNGPPPVYSILRAVSSFAVPPIQVDRGTRFPGAGFMQFAPEILPLSTEFFGIEFLFKTSRPSGLFFLAVNDDEEELVSIHLQGGLPFVLVDPDGCRRSQDVYAMATVNTDNADTVVLSYADNAWHKLNFLKIGADMRLTVDEVPIAQVSITCANNTVIGDITRVFVGGVPRDFVIYRNTDPNVVADPRKKVILDNLAGCVRDFSILTAREPTIIWTPLDWKSPVATSLSDELTEGCPLSLSPGFHFLGKGFLVMPSVPEPSTSPKVRSPASFRGGSEFVLTLSFRAEFHSGLLFFQYSRKTQHIMFVQLNRSVLEVGFLVGNEIDVANTTITRLTHLNFCDTAQKTVRITKRGSGLQIQTEDPVAPPFSFTGELPSDYLYLSSDIYVGGLGGPDSDAVKFVNALLKDIVMTESFGGCFLTFNISVPFGDISLTNAVPTSILAYLPLYGDISTVLADGCPPIVTVPSTENTCKSPRAKEIYNGQENSFIDTQLSPFTNYLYSVNASNVAGYSLSLWHSGRTLPLPPDVKAVQPPYYVMPSSGRDMLVKWRPPVVYSGMLTAYIVSAKIEDVIKSSVTIRNPGPTDTTATVSALKPYTQYAFFLTVCNTAGCSTSTGAMKNTTLPEAPEGMSPPTIGERKPWSLFLQWNEPFLLNGVLTGYQLFKDDIRIYAGQLLRFNVTGLKVATTNRYAVEACTVAGCSRSDSVLLTTSSLPPPAPIPSPLLTTLSSTEIRIAWLPVDSSNGIIQMYQIYMSLRPDEPLATSILAVDNETNPTTVLVERLTPGQTYYFRLTACTNGGCTTSDASYAITEEDIPKKIVPLNIISADPSRIDVFWDPPAAPNGILKYYVLKHNGRQVYSQLEPRHFAVTGLPPYSRNEFLLKACNRKGCASGNLTIAYSLEDVPQGAISLDPAIVVDSRTIRLRFWGPEYPNGNVTYFILASGLFLIRDETASYKVMSDTRAVATTFTFQQILTIGEFLPASNYTLRINATNSKGFLLSNSQVVQMPKGAPIGFGDPVVTISGPRSLNVRWNPAAWSNGDPVMGADSAVYMLQWRKTSRPDEIMNAFSFLVTGTMYSLNNMRPYTKYEVRVIASNSVAESTYSNWVAVTTPEDCPEGQDEPSISEVTATTAFVTWLPPRFPNGVIVAYNLFVNSTLSTLTPLVNLSNSSATTYQLTNLDSNSYFRLYVESCTVVCCNKSRASLPFHTPSAPPGGVLPPEVVADSPSSVLISWSKPRHPNGKLMWYVLERQLRDDDGILSTATVANISATADDLRFVDRQLMPYSEYHYRVVAVNDAGSTPSHYVEVRTKPSRPLGVLPPSSLNPVDPDSVLVSWAPPYRPNGPIEKFVIRVSSPADISVPVKMDLSKGRARGRSSSKSPETFQRVVTGLMPYTDYNITVSACSDGGGCSESPPLSFKTPPASPEDQLPPMIMATSQTCFFIQWTPPLRPNGPIKAYTLDRLKTREPLTPSGAGPLNEAWETVYIGNQTFYEDQGLPLFSFYQYRVTAISDFGRATSLPSAENSTFGDEPLAAPELFTSHVTHDSINISWTKLGVDVLRGAVGRYVVALQHERKSARLLPDSEKQSLLTIKEVPGTQNFVIFTDLIPSTAYTAMLTMHMYGGASKRAAPIRIATSDGTPLGLRPPTIRPVSETQLRLYWFPPVYSNGQIVKYIVYVDDTQSKVLPTASDGSPMTSFANDGDYSTVISDLRPYHVHSIILCACTKFACANSSKILATTMEALPKDLMPPSVVTRGPTWIAVKFSPPDSPNGIITRYDLFRKSTDHCPNYRSTAKSMGKRVSKRSLSDDDTLLLDPVEQTAAVIEPTMPSGRCHYVSCPIGHRQCGGVCYASNSSLTCCSGELFETRLNHVCCDSNYVAVTDGPLSEKVCCGGRLHKNMPGHECCYGNYVPVPPGSTCCYNSMQRNVIVSLGDGCCASLPYRPHEFAQVCFGGVLLNRPEQKACGRRLIPASKICCASSQGLNAQTESADPLPDHSCCGGKYYNTSTSKCCTIGKRSRLFSIDPSKPDMEMACCGLQLIPSGLACCNGKPFNRQSAVCADTSVQFSEGPVTYNNCGRGTLCPLGASALCDVCNFPTTERACLVDQRDQRIPAAFEAELNTEGWPRNWNGPLLAPLGLNGSPVLNSWCQPRYVRLYSNQTVTTLNDTELKPYTRYEYFVQVSNSVGSTNSSALMAATAEAAPAGLQPPRIVSNPDQLNVLRVNWDPPTTPNGSPILYKLYRDGILIFSGDTRAFVDTTDVAPFQTYTYWLVACNQVACVTSTRVSAATLESVPENFNAPIVAFINSSCVNLTWLQPLKPNGLITKYILTLREKSGKQRTGSPIRDTAVHTAGANVRWLIACSLRPYVQYEAGMEACTQVGCRATDWQSFITDAALPADVPEPRVLVVNFIHIDIIWRLPSSPNGPILQTILYRRRDGETSFSKMVSYDSSVTSPTLAPGSKTMNYSDFSVRPGYRYAYKVGYANPAGVVNSSEVLSYGVPLRPPSIPNRTPTAVSVRGPRQITVIAQQPVNATTEPTVANFDEVIVLIESETGVEREFYNGSVANFDLLTPYTLYEARVKSCFKPPEATCSYSDPVFVRTKSAPPDGPPLPNVFAQSAKSVAILWTPPSVPNGPVDRYEVYRRKIGEDMTLVATVPVVDDSDESAKESVNEKSTSYIDSDSKLQPFTTYEYRVAAVTAAGRGFSPWATVRTSQARPSVLRPLMANQTGPYGVEFVWSPPEHTNGPLVQYRIEYRRLNADPSSDVEVPIHSFLVSSNRLSVLISGLKPFSAYSARLIAENSVGAVESDWITFATPEAAPTDLSPITVEQSPSGSAVTLRWEEPLSPNGRITRYALYDTTKSESLLWTGSGRVFEYRRLRPFTTYSVMLEACTNAGCSKTQPQTFRTAEAPPDLLDPPVVKKLNKHAVKLRWTPPKLPNGEVIEYELLRFEHPLSKGSEGSMADDLREASKPKTTTSSTTSTSTVRTTVELPKQRRSVKTEEYDSLEPAENETNAVVVFRMTADTLDNGVFQFVDDGLRPFTRFRYRLRARNSRGLVEIDGPDEFETPEAVPSRIKPPRVLAADTDELRLRWSFPMEANGHLRSMVIHRQQYSNDREAIKDSIKKILIKNFQSHDYVDSDVKPDTEYAYALEACTTVGCNISRWRHVKTLAPPPEMYSAPTVSSVNSTSATLHWTRPNMKIEPDFLIGYRIAINGTELPLVILANRTSYTLNDLHPFHFYSVAVTACVPKPIWDDEEPPDDDLSEEALMETANLTKADMEFLLLQNLLCGPYSRPAAIQTDEAAPRNLSAPRPVAISASAIDVQWREPAEPNGFILEYVLYRNNSAISLCDACFSYTDYDLQPDTNYVYSLSARNGLGTVKSAEAQMRTAISSPDGVPPPLVKPLTATTVLATWEKPIKANGVIRNFTIYINTDEVGYTGLEQHAYISNLEPYTAYDFCVAVCTEGGCSRSLPTRLVTPEAPPQGMDPPTLVALADDQGQHSGVRASWRPPRLLNGIVTQYLLERRKISEQKLNSGHSQTVVGAPIFAYNGTADFYVDHASPTLEAFSLYEYRVTAVNSAGRVSSEWQFGRVQTEQAIPEGIKPPQVMSVTATSAIIKMLPPEKVNGYITEYRLYINGIVAERRNSPTDIQIDNLKPASAILIHVEVCTVVGCAASPPAGVKTPDAAPDDIKAPLVEVHNHSYVVISWQVPGIPNGNITSYTVTVSTNCKTPHVEVHDDDGEYNRVRQPPSPLCAPSTRAVAVVTAPEAPLEAAVTDLVPFTRYWTTVRMVNTHGYAATSPNASFITPATAPQYLRPPRVSEESSGKIRINWNDSFSLNSPLQHFTLSINDQTAYEGTSLSTAIFAEKDVVEFSMAVAAMTENGIAESPVSEFRVASRKKTTSSHDRYNTTRPSSAMEAGGILERPWFVIGISLIGLVCAAGLVVCACRRCFTETEKKRRLMAEAENLSSPLAMTSRSKREDISAALGRRSLAEISSTGKYVRQRAPLTDSSRHISMTKRRQKKHVPIPPNAPATNQQFFSLPHNRSAPRAPLSPVCLSEVPGLMNRGAIEHEAPSPPLSMRSLHIEVSGPTATGMAYTGAPLMDAPIVESANQWPATHCRTVVAEATYVRAPVPRPAAGRNPIDDSGSINSERFFQIWAGATDSGLMADEGAYEMPLR